MRRKKRFRIRKKCLEEKEGSLLEYCNVAPTVGEAIGEVIVKQELIQNNIVPYPRFIDVEGVDLITKYKARGYGSDSRTNYKPVMMYTHPVFNEIQVKYSKKHNSGCYGFNIQPFSCRPEYYFIFVCQTNENLFIVPSETLAKFRGERQGNIRIKQEREDWFMVAGINKMSINEYKNNFSPLKSPNAFFHG